MVLCLSSVVEAQRSYGPQIKETVVDALNTCGGHFDSLKAAIKKADLTTALQDAEDITVFAPTDEAFEKLLQQLDLESLDDVPMEALGRILKHHVVAGIRKAADLSDGDELGTLLGDSLDIEVEDGGVVVDGDALVIKADVVTGNGVVHVIDTVLQPEDEDDEDDEEDDEDDEEDDEDDEEDDEDDEEDDEVDDEDEDDEDDSVVLLG